MRVFVFIIVLLSGSTLFAQGTRGENPPPLPPNEPAHVEPVKDSVVVYDVNMVQELPKYPGGDEELKKYLALTPRYPAYEKENNIQGKVYVEFIIDEFGAVTNAKIKRGISKGLDNEALRVVMNMPRWTPGTTNGKPVKVRYVVPVSFRLN